jgi:hypothetical protein
VSTPPNGIFRAMCQPTPHLFASDFESVEIANGLIIFFRKRGFARKSLAHFNRAVNAKL